jgi:LytR cell envelope-related transcriptional attenuator
VLSRIIDSPWTRVVGIAVGALLLGFVVGWYARGDGGGGPTLRADDARRAPVTTAGGAPDGGGPVTTEAPDPLPARAQVRVVVLNGTGITGLAGRTAALLAAAGYPDPMADDGPPADGATLVYHRGENAPAAQRLADDLGGSAEVRPLGTGAVAQAAPADADLVVLLAGD